MRVLVVNRFFGDSQTPTGRMLYDVAKQLVERGQKVVVFTTDGQYVGNETSVAPRFPFEVEVYRVRQWKRASRIVNWLWFWFGAVVRIPLIRWDRCVLLTDPPFLILSALVPRLLFGRKRKTILWTMDLYPQALAVGSVVNESSLLYAGLQQLTELGLKAIDGVIALGPTQEKRLREYRNWRVDAHFSAVVSPWDDRPLPRVPRDTNVVIRRFGWFDKKVALYAGNLGEGHSHAEFIDAAAALIAAARHDWVVAFFVRGSGVKSLKQVAASLPNVVVSDYLPESETTDLLWAATVHLISMKLGWEGVVVPSKLYGALKTDAPILFVGPREADTHLEIRRLGRGKQIDPGTSGKVVVQTLDELAVRPVNFPVDNSAANARRVADFIVSDLKNNGS